MTPTSPISKESEVGAPKLLVAPSILSADFGRLAEEVAALAEAGADYIHVDVMDGHFVPNLTIGPPVIAAVRKATKLPLDVHLMIEKPDLSIDDYAEAGADIICVHAEASVHLHRTVEHIRSLGKRAAVSLNPHTPIDVVEYVLDMLDMVLLMSVNPGFGGQSFIPQVVPKISRLRKEIVDRKLCVDIEVDGGIKTDTVKAVVGAGANVLVSGSGVFGAGKGKAAYASAITALRNAAHAQ